MSEAKREFTRRSERIEELVHRLEDCPDLAMRAVAQELLQAVVELHGVALERMLDRFAEMPQADAALEELCADPVVSGVLSLHGIHPVALEDRVATALESARAQLHSHGGDVKLDSIEDGVVHVTLSGACGTCGSSAATMKSTVENAVYSAAPEIAAVVAQSAPARAQSELVTLQIR